MTYVDGFVAAVPEARKQDYIEHAARAAGMFREFGALRVTECWGDDVPEGELTSFPLAVRRAPDEVVVFSWIEWPSRAVRDAAWARVMADPRMADRPMPFDGRRMIYGGFRMVQDA